MRTGQTYGAAIQQVLQHTRNRSDRRVRWKHPGRPLIFTSTKQLLTEADEPMSVGRANAMLKEMAKRTGMTDRVTTHAIRWGAIRDVAHLPASAIDNPTNAISAAVAGHSRNALRSGLTDDYIGSLRVNFLNLRAEHSSTGDRAATRSLGVTAQRLRSSDVSRFMVTQGQDPNDQRARARACYQLRVHPETIDPDSDLDDSDFEADSSVADHQIETVK